MGFISVLGIIFLFSPLLVFVFFKKREFVKNIYPFNFLIWGAAFLITPFLKNITETGLILPLVLLLFPSFMIGLDIVAMRYSQMFPQNNRIIIPGIISLMLEISLMALGFFNFMGEAAMIFLTILPLQFFSIFVVKIWTMIKELRMAGQRQLK